MGSRTKALKYRLPLHTVPTPENEAYLRTKRERLGHLINIEPGSKGD